MLSIPKEQIRFVRRNKQITSVIACAAVATVPQLVMSEAVELLRVGPDLRVLVNRMDRGFDDDAGWEVLAVRERDSL